MAGELDVGELSTDKDGQDSISNTPLFSKHYGQISTQLNLGRAPPKPPSMVVALPNGLPPTRNEIPEFRFRRKGGPRKANDPYQHLLVWPNAQFNGVDLLLDDDDDDVPDEDDDDSEWARKYPKKKSKKSKSSKRRR